MVDKSLLERLQADVKRHRAPQVDILPSWAKSGGKSVIVAEPVAAKPLVDSKLEAPKKVEKERKIEKKAKKKKK